MRKFFNALVLTCSMLAALTTHAQEGLITAFKLEPNDLELQRIAKPGTPFDKVGRKFAILGDESGSFEAWAYPLKLLRNFEFSFFVRTSTRSVMGKDIVRNISVTPEVTTLTYTHQSFTMRAMYITPVAEPGAIILLDVDSTEPLTIVCGFLPILQPMWPAGIGGQYAYWSDKLHAYIISEPTGKNHGLIGSPTASGVSYTPAHMLSDAPNEFKIQITEPEKIRNKYIPIYIAGGKGPQEQVVKVYEKLRNDPEKFYRQNVEHYRNLRKSTLRVQTPNPQLNLAFEWAKVAFDNLVVDNPDLGKGLVAGLGASGTGGRPGFGWFFGGDAYINSFSLNSYGAYNTVRDVLAFTQKWQRKDGKMAHELSQAAAYIDWWNDYHYGYIHGDTTPFYIAAMYDYYKMSGDGPFIKGSWNSLKRAYQWSLKTDANGDGLMDNKKAGLGGVEYGELTGVATDIYLGAVWVRATYGMQYLAVAAGQKAFAKKAAQDYQKAKTAFNEKFWDEEKHIYAYAFNPNNERVKETSPLCAVGLMWHLGTPERTVLSLQKLNSSEFTTDWGIRNLSIKSKLYQPLNYNYGAVWPFTTSWVTTALFKHHFSLQGFHSLLATARHTFDNALGYITELFSGAQNVWPQEAVSHQGFSSAGVVLPFVRGMLGLEGDAIARTITFAPHFRADWAHVSVNNYRVGKASIAFDFRRSKNKITLEVQSRDSETYQLEFAPALGIGTNINGVTVNGNSVKFEKAISSQVVQAKVDVNLNDGPTIIEVLFDPTVELLPPHIETQTGDMNKGLKIISVQKEENQLKVVVEGLSGETYELEMVNGERIERVQGAIYSENVINLKFPQGNAHEFIKHEFIITTK